jgi:hypothetical protein
VLDLIRAVENRSMEIVPGTNCADALFSVRLPFEEVVRVLMDVLDLTVDEATEAATASQRRTALPAGTARRA